METKKVKHALIVQGSMDPWLGGNVVLAWMLEALKDQYQVTLVSWKPVDVHQVNEVLAPTSPRTVSRSGSYRAD